MRKKIRIIDTHSCFHFHEMFNSAFLVKLACSSDVLIKYYSDKSSWDNIRKIIYKNNIQKILDNVQFNPIAVIPKKWDSLSLLLRNIFGAIKNIYYYLIADSDETIIYSINNPLSLYSLNFLSKWNTKKNIRIICHGEIELLVKNFSKKQPSFIYKILINNFFKTGNISPNLKFILLGKHIKEELFKIYPYCKNENFLVMDHPYIIAKYPEMKEKQDDFLSLGTIGVLSENKGLNDLLSLTNNLKDDIENDKIKISIIGPHSLKVNKYPLLDIISENGDALDTDEYNKCIQSLDYILFFYKSPAYALTASGAIFDAIQQNKPIIGLKNNYFEYVFKKVGAIGYLVDNIVEIKSILRKIMQDGDSNIDMFYKNLEKARVFFDAKNQNEKIEI